MNIVSQIERENYFKGMENCLAGKNFKNIKVVLCPPLIHLESFKNRIKNEAVFFGAQNIHEEEMGRFTGEISAPMVKNFGGDYAIIGHSERRKYFSEDNGLVNEKVKMALKNNLIPVICIGETEEERANGQIKSVITNQLLESLDGIADKKISQLIITYEPVWAIGSGRVPTSDEIMEIRILMQKILTDKFNLSLDEMPQIIYGGSVEFKNIKEVCLESGMSGVLVGGESLHPMDFIKMGEVLENN
ncbi:MAG: Triosephosphate isomerase [Candidatus Moranbacteria bacterium GW2011_GWF2_34_56]|nr:MAG: Triosephosphate isomerase [Candidatus Moranbacteria bacterium GW2011_GWF1_34_10]KKP65326.1 MAG: Triosephosphate isomerase [Candidatus Moranbacteria bacterium GW2011_GWF2_34_56]